MQVHGGKGLRVTFKIESDNSQSPDELLDKLLFELSDYLLDNLVGGLGFQLRMQSSSTKGLTTQKTKRESISSWMKTASGTTFSDTKHLVTPLRSGEGSKAM